MISFDGNISTQMVKDLMKGDALLDLTFTNKVELVRDMRADGCSNQEIVEFRITSKGNKTKRINKSTFPAIRRADVRCFRDLLGRFPWDTALKKRVVNHNV